MKTAKKLLEMLGVPNHTQRHIKIINDFMANGETNVKILLSELGAWDATDLKQAEAWMKL